MVLISNVNNKYEMAVETTFGVVPGTFTQLNFGQIQSINISEEENMEKITSINGGHTANLFEDGLYWANVTIETQCTKLSLPQVLDACMGNRVNTASYTIVSSTNHSSYSLRVNWETTQRLAISGLVVKDFDISASKGETISITLNCIAKLCIKQAGTITTTKNTENIFKDLDTTVTIGGVPFVLNSFGIKGNWNISDDEGRGIEAVPAGERRLIQGVVKHSFDVSGSYEAEVDTNLEFGYTETRADETIVFTLTRGVANTHTFTLTNTRSGGRTSDLSVDNSKKMISYDYEALDLAIVGDL